MQIIIANKDFSLPSGSSGNAGINIFSTGSIGSSFLNILNKIFPSEPFTEAQVGAMLTPFLPFTLRDSNIYAKFPV